MSTGKKFCAISFSMENEEEILGWIILNALPDVGPITFCRLKERFSGKIHHIFSASYEDLAS
ncbi:MAG: hypothetical protein LBB05_04210, partial [Puniceicoccales bacterium]|nr:hypothetical protein [Puniceicoccales bacterium]